MKMWNKLLAVLDQVYGFPNMASSTLKKLEQGYDNETEEHVIRLEYLSNVSVVSGEAQ